jgi:pSer/pThr/pTyr-binding forkhead associated (FHA) protein
MCSLTVGSRFRAEGPGQGHELDPSVPLVRARDGGTLAAVMVRDAVPADTAPELKRRIEAERRGMPFLIHRDGSGEQVLTELDPRPPRLAVGRADAADVRLDFDPEVSRLHAELERAGGEWLVIDDGLSANGTFVNGERVVARRRLRDGDALRFGSTLVVFRAPGESPSEETARAGDVPDASSVSETQKRVLVALCRPFGEGSEFATPATNKRIAAEVFLSVDAVKAHLRALFRRFGIAELPQNQKRVRLAELAMRAGVVAPRDLEH